MLDEGADDVVRLDAGYPQQRQAHRLDDGEQGVDLGFEFVRHRRAIGLVFRIQLVPEGLALRVEDHRDVGRVVLVDELVEHVDAGAELHRVMLLIDLRYSSCL